MYDGEMPSIVQLEKLINIDPDDPFVHYGLGQELAKIGEHERAVECYSRVIELDSTYCYAYFFKGQALEHLGRADEARAIVAEGIESAKEVNDAKAIAELTSLLQSMS